MKAFPTAAALAAIIPQHAAKDVAEYLARIGNLPRPVARRSPAEQAAYITELITEFSTRYHSRHPGAIDRGAFLADLARFILDDCAADPSASAWIQRKLGTRGLRHEVGAVPFDANAEREAWECTYANLPALTATALKGARINGKRIPRDEAESVICRIAGDNIADLQAHGTWDGPGAFYGALATACKTRALPLLLDERNHVTLTRSMKLHAPRKVENVRAEFVTDIGREPTHAELVAAVRKSIVVEHSGDAHAIASSYVNEWRSRVIWKSASMDEATDSSTQPEPSDPDDEIEGIRAALQTLTPDEKIALAVYMYGADESGRGDRVKVAVPAADTHGAGATPQRRYYTNGPRVTLDDTETVLFWDCSLTYWKVLCNEAITKLREHAITKGFVEAFTHPPEFRPARFASNRDAHWRSRFASEKTRMMALANTLGIPIPVKLANLATPELRSREGNE